MGYSFLEYIRGGEGVAGEQPPHPCPDGAVSLHAGFGRLAEPRVQVLNVTRMNARRPRFWTLLGNTLCPHY